MEARSAEAHAVVMDVVGSRHLVNLAATLAHAEAVVAASLVERGSATSSALSVGDELQAVYVDVPATHVLRDVVRLRLALLAAPRDGAPQVELRFGIGAGELIGDPGHAAAPAQSGSAWWHARTAIETAGSRRNGWPQLRWWYEADSPTPMLHALLVLVDTVLPGLAADDAHAALALLDGAAAADVATDIGRSASALSRRLHGRGVYGLVRAVEQLEGDPRG